jgi:hypothetical protein
MLNFGDLRFSPDLKRVLSVWLRERQPLTQCGSSGAEF